MQSQSNELQQYLATPEMLPVDPQQRANIDLLDYWRARKCIFPVLSRLALDVFAVPVSTVSSEQTFSASGRILNERRTKLSQKMIEVLTCLRDWERSRHQDQYEVVDDTLIESFQFCNIDDTDEGGPSEPQN